MWTARGLPFGEVKRTEVVHDFSCGSCSPTSTTAPLNVTSTCNHLPPTHFCMTQTSQLYAPRINTVRFSDFPIDRSQNTVFLSICNATLVSRTMQGREANICNANICNEAKFSVNSNQRTFAGSLQSKRGGGLLTGKLPTPVHGSWFLMPRPAAYAHWSACSPPATFPLGALTFLPEASLSSMKSPTSSQWRLQ